MSEVVDHSPVDQPEIKADPMEFIDDRIKHWEVTLNDARHAVHVAVGQLAMLYEMRARHE